MEKHELELVTSNFTMSCNVMLQDCTRHNCLVCFDAVDEKHVMQPLDSVEMELAENASGFMACFPDDIIRGCIAEGKKWYEIGNWDV
jgi:hypothetical protein